MYTWFVLCFACFGCVLLQNEDRKLIYLQIVTSSGHHAPLRTFWNDENSEDDWPEGFGSLTKLGKLQHYELGKFLRKMYEGLITSDPSEVDAFSSREDRSIVSVLCLLASLCAPTEKYQFLPGFIWQPPTLQFVDRFSKFFSPGDECLGLQEEWDILLDTPKWKDQLEKDKFFYSFWSNASGDPLVDPFDVVELYDILQKENQAGLPIPTWARKYPDHMTRIAESAYSLSSNKTQQLVAGSLLDLLRIRMLVKDLEENPTPSAKLSVYSTHDWNIASILQALQQYNGMRPPPSSTILFELYRQQEQYSVRTLYLNSSRPELGYQEPFLLHPGNCKDEFCPFQNFNSFLDSVVPSDYVSLCKELVIIGSGWRSSSEESYSTYSSGGL